MNIFRHFSIVNIEKFIKDKIIEIVMEKDQMEQKNLGGNYILSYAAPKDPFDWSINSAIDASVAVYSGCNFSCDGCYANKQKWEMPVEMYSALLDIGFLRNIEFSFGESTMHKDLDMLVDLTLSDVSPVGPRRLIIVTNGFDKEILTDIIKKGKSGLEINLSMDPFHAKQYEKEEDLIETARYLKNLAEDNNVGFDIRWRERGSDFIVKAMDELGYDPQSVIYCDTDDCHKNELSRDEAQKRRQTDLIFVGPHGLIYDNDHDFIRAIEDRAVGQIVKIYPE